MKCTGENVTNWVFSLARTPFKILVVCKKQPVHSPNTHELFGKDEYIDFIVRFIEQLNPNFVIERFAGEVPPKYNAGPGWGLIRNDQINVAIEKELEKRNTWQGKYYIG